MKKLNLKRYFEGFDNIIRSLLIISLFLFFLTFFLFEEMAKWNYTTYVPAAALVALCLIYYIKKKIVPNVKPLIPIYVFVGIAYFVSLIVNPIAALAYKTLLVLAFFATTIYLSCFIIKDTKAILWAMLLGGLIFCAAYFGVYWKEILKLNFSKRLGSFFGNENSIGMKLCVSAALLGSICIYSKKYWALVFDLPVFVLIFSTGSRTAVLQAGIIVVYFIFAAFRKKMKLAVIISLAAIVLFVLAIYLLPPFEALKKRFVDSIDQVLGISASDASTFTRQFFRDDAFYLSFKKLLTGYGVDGFCNASGTGTYSHNNISELLCDFGIFGLISHYAIYICIAFKLLRNAKKPRMDWVYFVLLLCDLLTAITAITYYDKMLFVLFALCIFVNETNKDPEGEMRQEIAKESSAYEPNREQQEAA